MNSESVLGKGIIEPIGLKGTTISHSKFLESVEHSDIKEYSRIVEVGTHEEAIEVMLDALIDKEYGAVKSLDDIVVVGHRVVHGGEFFTEAAVIDDLVITAIRNCARLAPLHNPANLLGIEAVKELLPQTLQVAVFDTAFHQQLPEKAYLYGLPYELYENYGIRRYGFHGSSHNFLAHRVAELFGKPLESLRIITLHLGNGASIAAIKNGISIDTSMGFTPLEGLVMGTRSGSFDPSIVTYIMEKEKLDYHGINTLLNKKSGVLGISGVSSDFRDLEEAANDGNQRAEKAIQVFVYNLVKYIGAYYVVTEGLDALVFSAGIGENSPFIRACVCDYLSFTGLKIDKKANMMQSKEMEISTVDSAYKAYVIPTNEELMIAREAKRLYMIEK